MSTASSRTRSFVPRYGIAGVGASCSPFKVDPRQSAGQARGARPPAGMCTRQEEEEEEEDQEEGEGEGGGAEKRAGALRCPALPSFWPPAASSCPGLWSHQHPSISSRGAQGRQQTSKQTSKQAMRPLATRQSTKAGQLYCESLIIAALLPIRLKRNARHSKPVVATQQRILRIALTRERNVDDVIGFGFKWFALVCSAAVR